ncbi:SpoIIE family protein phosphatase [Streptomyces pactum]|uniref:SpoIIE family protein phosphatase n=1 Tax=Streptomyces pactum TaxID=68249 RepID=A0ABS0NJD7_9ACTN|nr:SpoIIE family protein phosphatase [Streptomyces pactum]
MGTGEAPRWRQSADPPPAPCPDPPGPGAATGAAGAEDSADTPPEEPADRLRALAEARDRLQALLDAVLTISRELELPVVLRRIVTTAMDLVGARYGALGVLDGTGSRLDQFITAGLTEQERADLAGIDFPRGRGVLGHLIHHPQPLRLTDLTAHPASVGFPPGHPHMRTLLGAAITVRGKVYGDLYLSERHDGQPFDAQDEEILVALAGAAGIAIANARLYEQVHSGAEHFQRLLLPAVPDLRPFEAAAVYRPAAQPHHLGGDWYDTMLLPDGSCAAVIGDVVGHDLNAAAAMAQARNMLRALVYDRCTPPSEVLHQLDRTLQAITDVPVTTACLARLEPDPPAPAGHPPPHRTTPAPPPRRTTPDRGRPPPRPPTRPPPGDPARRWPGPHLHLDAPLEQRRAPAAPAAHAGRPHRVPVGRARTPAGGGPRPGPARPPAHRPGRLHRPVLHRRPGRAPGTPPGHLAGGPRQAGGVLLRDAAGGVRHRPGRPAPQRRPRRHGPPRRPHPAPRLTTSCRPATGPTAPAVPDGRRATRPRRDAAPPRPLTSPSRAVRPASAG